MTIHFQITGEPGRDNSLFVRIDSGQLIERLLFDCGENCLDSLSISEIQSVDHLLFSHLHMDHIGGFDTFFRCNYDRITKRNTLWGPPETAKILQHRFQGYLWNLHVGREATWHVCDVHPTFIDEYRFELSEAFAESHYEEQLPHDRLTFEGVNYQAYSYARDHQTTTLAWLIKEKPRWNVDTEQLKSMGLSSGPWLRDLKNQEHDEETVNIDGKDYEWDILREKLLIEIPGNSIAYLTDFLLNEEAMEQLSRELKGCDTVVCEGQYRHNDLELAMKNHHMTTVLSAELAQRAEVGELVLFHLSDRYQAHEWLEMLSEAQAIFPKSRYPEHWEFANVVNA